MKMMTSKISNRIKAIKKNFEYIRYLEDHGINYQETNSEEIRINCPACDDNDYKCYINDDKKTFICFKCQLGSYGNGDVFALVGAIEGITNKQAIARLLQEYREVTPEDFTFEDEEDEEITDQTPSFLTLKTIPSLPTSAKPVSSTDPRAAPYLEYLLTRGLSEDDIAAMQAHYVRFGRIEKADGKKVDISKRVLWPVYGEQGLVSWLARSIDPNLPAGKPKYINLPDSDMSKTVWPHVSRPPSTTECVLVEGLLDCMAIRRTGVSAYCVWKKQASPAQIDLISYWGYDTIKIFFDPGAEREAAKLAESLRLRFKAVHIVDNTDWPKNQDSGDLLKHPNGVEIISDTLTKSFNINDEWKYLQWQMKIRSTI